jgi:lysyl-tRNA synthetase class 2
MSLPKRFPAEGEPERMSVADARAWAERLDPGEVAEPEIEGEENPVAVIAGRIMARRDMGSAVFLDLVDRSGRMQLAFLVPEIAQQLDVNLGDIVGVKGVPGRTRRGEPTLFMSTQPVVLAKNRRPLPDKVHGLQDVELRYRQRYLDLLVNEESRADALLRSRVVSAIRRYLDAHGFVEVETPILQPRYGGAFAEPFVTHHNALDADYYLRIATELYLKRLIVGGLEKVYEIGKDFRNEGTSYKHQPEFTMLEWYEAYADYRDTMARMEELVATVAQEVNGTTTATFRGHELDLGSWRRLKLLDALDEHGLWTRDEAELRNRLQEREVDTKHDTTWAQLVDHALERFVEPALIEPTILHDYPIELSPFARATDDDPSIVERFEYFVGGMELGNAFSELNDAEEQAERFAMQASEREAGAGETELGDEDYVEALSYGMPPTGGLGLGIDRLTMVLAGRDTIRDVILFPALRER